MSPEAKAYTKHKNLKIAALELGIKWQTLYCRLKAQGVNVIGDKSRYGTSKDKLGNLAEKLFKNFVPYADDMNSHQFQSKFDFLVNGFKVDVKASLKNKHSIYSDSKRWAFSLKRQNYICDFICCFCMNESMDIETTLLIPREFFIGLQTLSVSTNRKSKWFDFEINTSELIIFFNEINKQNKNDAQSG